MSTNDEPAVCIGKKGISSCTYDDLVHYFKYASSAYVPVCPRPNGKHLVTLFSNVVTDIQGFVARDDERKEVVVCLRGSLSLTDFLLDSQLVLIPFKCPGISAPSGCRVHSGFLLAWDSIVVQILAILVQQLGSHEGYSVVTVGHSLGGALSILAAACVKGNFPEVDVRNYSYGAPRVGNEAFAEWFNEEFPPGKAFRVVHGDDGAPTLIPTSLGYHHTGVEYWQLDPPNKDNVIICSADGEDATCSASVPSQGINHAHTIYLGIHVATPFCMGIRL
ncbi:alpha/beta-hydrolase [Pluteus cervinus]|uniref:Alpha/beta-hydrolase n=1 Tax=Pluteus cervinus TaxID=181527 RepID=A0ACD3B548_9AGAR|nr:alpha/beta-hydrolase [Pluteus cervinus]